MEIYNKLPVEIQNKIIYFTLEHPCAKIIKDEIEALNCDKMFKFKYNHKTFCVVDGKMFFCNEYFRKFNYETDDDDEFIDKITDLLFDISDTSSDDSF
jgi:hypothetical protein